MIETKTKQTTLSDHLTDEYRRQQSLFSAQPAIIQRFLEVQGKQIAEAIIDGGYQVSFSLPDRIICTLENESLTIIPQNQRTHSVGGFINRLRKEELYKQLRHSLAELEQSPNPAISVAASLLRHAAVLHMVYNMLPAGRSVTYKLEDNQETIPSVPEYDSLEAESAITSEKDAIAEEGKNEEGRGELLVPFVPYARKFFLPQWVAFNENGGILAKSVEEAEAHVKSMQRFMEVLFLAVALAPYISADDEYAKKRYGMLGQLINQGRALAVYHARKMIAHIKERASSDNLNRGLSLSLPYFDDQELRVDETKLEVIPAGRIMFVPAFVVRAVRQEEMKISQDTRLNKSTRKHLLSLLELFEQAFETA
ncbi:MAG: hypothetical protein HZB50_12670 [Chloroflexi bacterium]|nr:hypothetical protein [Chloroflexota bacterium]